eukprot:3914545-Rhodomonas_salina.1
MRWIRSFTGTSSSCQIGMSVGACSNGRSPLCGDGPVLWGGSSTRRTSISASRMLWHTSHSPSLPTCGPTLTRNRDCELASSPPSWLAGERHPASFEDPPTPAPLKKLPQL